MIKTSAKLRPNRTIHNLASCALCDDAIHSAKPNDKMVEVRSWIGRNYYPNDLATTRFFLGQKRFIRRQNNDLLNSHFPKVSVSMNIAYS
jgi:hypothetical protein